MLCYDHVLATEILHQFKNWSRSPRPWWSPPASNKIKKIISFCFALEPILADSPCIIERSTIFPQWDGGITNSTDFILDFYTYDYASLVSCFVLEPMDFEESSYSQLPQSFNPDYKFLHARKIPHHLSFNSQTIPDCIRYIIGVFCYNFKSQTNILASY